MYVELMGLAVFVGSFVLVTSIAFTYLERRLQSIETILSDDLHDE